MPSLRTWRQATVAGGLGLSLAGVDAFEAAQHHGTAGKDQDGVAFRPPPPGLWN